MRKLQPIELALLCAVELALFGLVASVALALLTGFSVGDVYPWWIANYVRAFGWTPEVGTAARIGAAAAVLAPLALLLRPGVVDFGQARFARTGEVSASGLFASSGVLLGNFGRRFLRSGDPFHVLVTAPTRSGKGVGFVIPNLLSWPGSAVVLDIKYENHELTSGFRKANGQRVFRFSPADPSGRSHRYNPLDSVRESPAHRVSDLQRLAAIVIPAGRENSFWQDEARNLFVGLALYVLDTPELPHTLGQIYRTAMSPGDPLDEFCRGLLKSRPDLDPACKLALGSYPKKSEKERSGVRSTLTAALSLWSNPVIDAATSASDFSLADLRRTPTTIYVAVSLDQLPFVMKLLNVFFEQAVTLLCQTRPGADEPHRVLFLLDEFASLGRMDVLKSSLAFVAGYGVRVCTIIQGLGQLDDLYGRAGRESILQNSALQVFFAANDETTTRHVSERLGTKTIRTETRTFPSGSRLATKSYGHASRALLLPEEVGQLGGEELLLFKEGVRAVRGRKIRYYRDRAFAGRRGEPAAAVPELELRPATARDAALKVVEEALEAAPEGNGGGPSGTCLERLAG